MKITIHTEGWYDAAHHILGHESGCQNLHGHTYRVEVWVRGDESDLNHMGILWDFGNLKKLLKPFDHNGDMTETMGKNSTAENQALLFYKTLKASNKHLDFKVRVYEQVQPKESYAEVGDWE